MGYFETVRFAVPFKITLGQGWGVVGFEPDLAAFGHNFVDPKGWIDVIVVAAVLDPPCLETDPTFLGERPEDVVDWLSTRPWLDHSVPRPYNVGAYLGRSVDITVPTPDRWTCPNGVRRNIAQLFRLGAPTLTTQFGSLWGADVGERKRFVAIDVGGRTVTLVIGSPFPDVVKLWSLAEPALQTIEFTGAKP